MKRFNLFNNLEGDILRHANQIKLELMVGKDGQLWMSYEISGDITHFEDDQDEGGTCCEVQPDAAELADDLLRRFVAAKGGA